MYIFDEVVAVGFHTLYYGAERYRGRRVLKPPHESTTHNFEEGLFSAAKMARLKNTSKFALRKLADDMCAFRARNDKVFIGV